MPIHNNQPPGQWATPRPQYVPGSDPATANQGYTAQDFWDGKAGFGAGWGGAQKQEWLQNNMSGITGHNYIPDLTAHKANVAATLATNNANAMGQLQANPAYQGLQNGPMGNEVKDNRSYIERQGGMYGSGMDRQNFAAGLTTGDPTATAAAAANTAKWKDPVFLDSYYKSILPPDQYAQWKAQQAQQQSNPFQGSGQGVFGNPTRMPPISAPPVPPGTGGLQPPMGGSEQGGTMNPAVQPGGMQMPGSDMSTGGGAQGGMNATIQPVKPLGMPGGNPGYTGIAGRMWQGGSGSM